MNLDAENCERKLNQFSNECNDENKDIIFQIKLKASETNITKHMSEFIKTFKKKVDTNIDYKIYKRQSSMGLDTNQTIS